MRRKRRNKATWFPVLASHYDEGEGAGVTWTDSSLTFAGPASPGDMTIAYEPLTLDNTKEEDTDSQASSLRDYVEGQDYLLQRVVGQVWMGPLYPQDVAPTEVIGCIALAVLPSTPLGAPDLDPEDWNPLLAKNSAQPWIWRRTWRIDNVAELYTNISGSVYQGGYPPSTAFYGSSATDGFLDARSKRRIIKEHRLYIIAAAGVLQVGVGTASSFMDWGYDLRVLGQMRRGKNKSSF